MSCKGNESSGLSRLFIEIPICSYYWGVGGIFRGYLAISGAKSDVICLLSDIDFLYRRQHFAHISLNFRDSIFGYLGVFGKGSGGRVGLFSVSGEKSDVIFLITDPDFV